MQAPLLSSARRRRPRSAAPARGPTRGSRRRRRAPPGAPLRRRHQRGDRAELVTGAQGVGVGRGRGEDVGEHLGDRYAERMHGVDELGGHAVAGGQEAVLGERLLGVDELVRRVALLELQSRQRLHERAQGGRRFESWLRVHDAHLDGAEPGLRPHVPPEEGGLRDRSRAQEQLDGGDPVLVVREAPRQPGAREGLKQDRPVGGQPGRPTAPQRRAGRKREEQREVGAQAVQQPYGALGIRHADVHVQGERRLAPGDPAHRALHHLVAAGRRDLRVLGHLAGMHARRGHLEADGPRVAGEPRAQAAELGHRPAHRVVGGGGELERRLVGLGRAASGEVLAECRQQRVGALGERPGLGIEEHHLLLEAHRVRGRRLPRRPLGLYRHRMPPGGAQPRPGPWP